MTTTDPEYDRLRDAVERAGIALTQAWKASTGMRVTNLEAEAAEGLRDAVFALCDYRTKSTPPDPVPLRVEPPEEHLKHACHWLVMFGTNKTPAIWSGGKWTFLGADQLKTATEAYDLGYRYAAPCIPPSPCKPDTRIEPTDEAIEAFMRARGMIRTSSTRNDLRAALAHFSPTITKDQWEEIRKKAISDAPESFPYGVAKVLGR